MNNAEKFFMDEALEFVNPDRVDHPAKEIAQMWTDYAKAKADDARFAQFVTNALWADKFNDEYSERTAAYIKAAEEADAYFATINKEETPLNFLLRKEDLGVSAPAEKKAAHRRKADIRHKAKNAETLRKIHAKATDNSFTRKSDRSAADFKFFNRDLDDLIRKGKRLSEIGGVPKRKNYSKATRQDPDVVMRGNGYKKSENWKVKGGE